jgi:hypothetical protein
LIVEKYNPYCPVNESVNKDLKRHEVKLHGFRKSIN